MTNLDSMLKSRDITLLTRVRIVKATVFQQLEVRAGYEMNGYENRTIKRLSTEELMPSNCGAGEVS